MKSPDTPSVAVITRTKDRPLLLERTIKSVMGQSFKDFVMVIVNDGGDPKLIEELIRKHEKFIAGRIKLVSNKTTTGMENAANAGVQSSDSKYIAMLDDDDTWHPNFLKTTVEYLESNPYEGVVTVSSIVRESIEGDEIKKLDEERFVPFAESIKYFSLIGANQFTNNSFVYSRKAQKKVGDYDQSSDVVGDWEFNARFMRFYDIALINKPLAYYHHRHGAKGADSNTIYDDSHAKNFARILNKSLREDLDKGTLGIGFVANVSHLLDNIRADLRKESINIKQDTLHIPALESRLNEIEQRLARIEELSIPFEKRVKGYVNRRLKK